MQTDIPREVRPLSTPDDIARAFVESGEHSLLTWTGWAALRQRKQGRPRSRRLRTTRQAK
jgi:hypothetical protein